MIELITEPLQYGFFQRALLEVAIIGALCGLVGHVVILYRPHPEKPRISLD